MFILKPLKRRAVALLWGGQVLSAVGDEVYRVALVWLAIDLVGAKAGYIGAVQSASLLIFGILGGAWADRWDHRRTMIGVDTFRFLAVLAPPLLALVFPLSVWMLVPVAIIVSSLSAFFDPALQATVPELAPDEELRQASTALLDATKRVARVLGPGLVAVLNRWIPTLQFFTLDAASFALSAASVAALHRELPGKPGSIQRPQGIWKSFGAAIALVRTHRLLSFAILGAGVTWSMWSLGLTLGLGLLLHDRMPKQVGVFGLVLSAYGVGNLVSNLVVGSFPIRRPARSMFLGLMIVGTGLAVMAMASSPKGMMVAAAVAAIGGPLDDLSLLAVIQGSFRGTDIARIYRLLLAFCSGCTLIAFLASASLFRAMGPTRVTLLSGVAIFLVGLIGMVRFVVLPALRFHGAGTGIPVDKTQQIL